MNETRQSLLLRAQTGETSAWKDLTDLYRPLILGWLNRQGVAARDLEDLSQEVLLSVVKHLPGFRHSGHRGAFRSWLRTIVCSRTADYWRAMDAGTQGRGGSGATAALQDIADPDSELNRQWDEEHDRYVLQCLLDMVEEEFEPIHSASLSAPGPGRHQRGGSGPGTGAVRGGRLRGEVARAPAHPSGGGRAHRLKDEG